MSVKTLIVYYSLTGHTGKLAGKLAEALGCPAVKLPVFGSYKLDTGHGYDLVLAGTPVWFWAPAFPVSRFLARNRDRLPGVAFFCTYDTGIGNSFEKMGRKCGRAPLGTLAVMGSEVGSPAGDSRISPFVGQISKGLHKGDVA